jgi:hypothetical protein
MRSRPKYREGPHQNLSKVNQLQPISRVRALLFGGKHSSNILDDDLLTRMALERGLLRVRHTTARLEALGKPAIANQQWSAQPMFPGGDDSP